jgi:putative SOS response-associated peptidase YedK
MLTLETAIQKIQQFPHDQRNKVIEYIEFLEFQAHRQQEKQPETPLEQNQDFFALAGIWEGKNITLDNIRKDAWGEKNNDFV